MFPKNPPPLIRFIRPPPLVFLKAFGANALAAANSAGDTTFILSKKPGLTLCPPPAAINADLKACASLLGFAVTPGGKFFDPSNPLKSPLSAALTSLPARPVSLPLESIDPNES